MENQIVTHITQNGRYRVKLERAASTKGVIGYVIEVNGDDIPQVLSDIDFMRSEVEKNNPLPVVEGK